MLVLEIVLYNNLLTLVDIISLYCVSKKYNKKYKYCLNSGNLNNPNNDKLQRIFYDNINLKKLDIYFCNRFTFKTFRVLTKSLKNLKYLTINNSRIYDLALHIIANNCKHLEFISLNSCKYITDNGIKIFVRDCKTITTISLDCCNITNNSLRYIGRYSPQILNLSLCCCYSITDLGLIYLANSCKKLITLYLIDTHITDFGLYNITINCKQLYCLDLVYCNLITDETIYSFNDLHYISILYLGNMSYITDDSIQLLLNKCITLQIFSLYKCDSITDNAFKLINNNSCKIIELDLSYCNKITDKSMKIICKYWNTLEKINIKSTNITNETAKYITNNCKCIKEINLENTKITDIAVKYIALYCDLLEIINLSKCSNITYDGVRYIFNYCKNLRYVSLYKYKNIRKYHFTNKVCKYLENVYIDNMEPVKLCKIK